MAKDILKPDMTYIKLRGEKNFQEFIKGFIELLKTKFEQVEVHGNNYIYSYYRCGHIHHPHNPNWKPFQHLWNYCERNRYDFFKCDI